MSDRTPCPKHAPRYVHVCDACRRADAAEQPAAPIPAAWQRACAAPDDNPTAYPPATKSRLTIQGAVQL